MDEQHVKRLTDRELLDELEASLAWTDLDRAYAEVRELMARYETAIAKIDALGRPWPWRDGRHLAN